jgi:hypothetical protein
LRQYIRKLRVSNHTFPAQFHEGKSAIWHLENGLNWFQPSNTVEVDSLKSLLEVANVITSSLLETIIMSRAGMALGLALKTVLGMSLISMIAMESAMNITDWVLTGGALLTWWAIPLMLVAGFVTPLPYNYWRLKKWGKACH